MYASDSYNRKKEQGVPIRTLAHKKTPDGGCLGFFESARNKTKSDKPQISNLYFLFGKLSESVEKQPFVIVVDFLLSLLLTMGRGKFKAKPTGQRHFSTPEELLAGTSSRPRTFKRQEAEYKEEEEEESGQESGEESDDETDQKRKGTQGVIEINNPNLVKPKNLKAGDVDTGKTTELSRREREELEKQRAHERYMRLQEQGKTEQARKDLGKLIRYCYTSYQTYLCYFLHLSDSKYRLSCRY
ncbi:hypothetical protein POUND7_002808 [Theobroma cacao]